MRIMRKLDILVTTIELVMIGIRLVTAVKEGLEMKQGKNSKGA